MAKKKRKKTDKLFIELDGDERLVKEALRLVRRTVSNDSDILDAREALEDWLIERGVDP